MITNKAPKRIWINLANDLPKLNGHIDKDSVEYICADVFIKKIKEAFCKAICNGHPSRSTCTSLGTCTQYDKFIKYMKGE